MRVPVLLGIAAAALTAACHSAPPPESPLPDPTHPVTMHIPNQDSIDGANRYTADSLERVRQAQLARRAYSDSVEQARTTAFRNNELRTELAVMVNFDLAQASLRPEGRDALDRKVAILNANPDVRPRITGAEDERGSNEYNQTLGSRRAAEVRKYLVAKGIDRSRLDQMSTGETLPSIPAAMRRRGPGIVVSSS
jgi:outer membrane protein OmpA-like peptidoglycan-associated protein